MNDVSGTELPVSIEAAWGVAERPGKGPKRGLSLERIVKAGVTVAARDGLPAVSMARVATELGASTMALYRYVAAKDELLLLMVDSVLGAPPDVTPERGWRAELNQWAWSYLRVLRRHPWALKVPITGLPVTPNQVAWFDHGLRSMGRTGLAESEKASVILLMSGFVRNDATVAADIDAAWRASGSTPEQAMADYGRTLAKLAPVEKFPALHAVLRAGVLDAPDDPDDEFTFGLGRLLDGIEVLVRERTAGGVEPIRR